jgi:uncharacterized membrane protein YheB (UPF0754 family)
MLQELAIEALKGAAVGAVIGYATNQLAIWMLFHPRREVRVLGRRLPFTPGLVVKNQVRLAESVGQTVAKYLLDADTLVEHLRGMSLRGPIGEALDGERRELLAAAETVLEKAGEENREALLALKAQLAQELVERAPLLLRGVARGDSPVMQVLSPVMDELLSRPLRDLLTEEQRRTIESAAAGVAQRMLQSERLRGRLHGAIGSLVQAFLQSPAMDGMRDLAREAILRRVPELQETIQSALSDFVAGEEFGEVVREQLTERLHQVIIERFPRVGRLVGRSVIHRAILQRWPDIVEELQEFFRGPVFGGFMQKKLEESSETAAEALRDAVASPSLRTQLTGWLQEKSDDWLDHAAEEEGFRSVVRELLSGLWEKTPRELLASVGARGGVGALADRAAEWLESDAGRQASLSAAERLIENAFLQQEVRRLAALVPEEEWAVVSQVTARVVEQRILRALPRLLTEHLDLSDIISAKIRTFDPAELEEAILSTSRRELKGIVRLGGVIGLVVGAVAQVINYLL